MSEYRYQSSRDEVFKACCVHDAGTWILIFAGLCGCLFFLYFFLFGLDLLGTGAKVMAGCRAGPLFGDDTNPIAGVMVGILATVLLQSSSTTTSIVVSLVLEDDEAPADVDAADNDVVDEEAAIKTEIEDEEVA